MFSDKELEILRPKISIEYRTEPGFLKGGNFDDIPEDAFGAYVRVGYPSVNAQGEIILITGQRFDLYVGQKFEVKDTLEQIANKLESGQSLTNDENQLRRKLEEYAKKGIKRVVSTKMGVISLENDDAVFSTHDDMAQTIRKIAQSFNSLGLSVNNMPVNNQEQSEKYL